MTQYFTRYLSLFLLSTLLMWAACGEKPIEPQQGRTPHETTPFSPEIPIGLPELPNPDINPMTLEGVTLGRMLYYDNILSMNGQACASCHNQQASFSAPGPGPTGTDILAHINLGYNPEFGWTGGTDLLDHVALADLEEGNVFLNANNDSIVARLSRHAEYPDLFWKAFGVEIVQIPQEDRHNYISYALAQFMRTLISGDSRFDKFARREPDADFTQSEFNGYSIFFSEKGDCFHCHGYPLFTDNDFHNNGLDSVFDGNNLGRYEESGKDWEKGKFGSPTLRNIAMTPPYMHDGRFQTLKQVVEHYNTGVKPSATLDPIMTKPGKEQGLGLSEEDIQDLVNFLHTLTDTSFLNNKDLSSPF